MTPGEIMSRIILVTGGGRSGKSRYAQRLAESLAGPRVFIATCPVIDDEMADRIRRHQAERTHGDWTTIEEPVDLAGALRRARQYPAVLVDCLALWVNNLMWEAEQQGRLVDEDEVARRAGELAAVYAGHPGTVIFVTNEVGLGIIPENALARRYRDLLGRCNQTIAHAAAEVTLLVCGQPLTIKCGARSAECGM